MIDADSQYQAKLASIFHPSDFSEASDIAFEHALRIALVTGARLEIMHVTPEAKAEWSEFPEVRTTLNRWRLLPEGSPRSAVAELGIDVRKRFTSSDNPVKACLDFLNDHPAELIVLAVHQHKGHMRWLEERVGQPIAQRAGAMTLYVPHGVAGFVSRADGSVSLKNVLIPIADKPRAQPAVEAAALMILSLGLPSGTLHLLHVGSSTQVPIVTPPVLPGWTLNTIVTEGEPDEVIVQTADRVGAELIVMTTEGPNGFLDALRGSTSERVLRRTRCPVVSLPAHQWMSPVRRFWRPDA